MGMSSTCGTLSPVSVDSLTTARPRSSRQSAGTWPGLGLGLEPAPNPNPNANPYPNPLTLTRTRVDSVPRSARLSEIRSPGRRSAEVSGAHAPSRCTSSGVGAEDMPRSVVMLRC